MALHNGKKTAADNPLENQQSELSGQIVQQLERILDSAEFAASKRLSCLLSYIVSETLAGRGERLKAYTIAVEAFDLSENFDPQANSIVRIHASKLRRALERYYLTDGTGDPVCIDLPKGTYQPCFIQQAQVPTQKPGRPVSNHSIGRPRLAVLSLFNQNADYLQDTFIHGLTEELIVGLSKFPHFELVSLHLISPRQGQPCSLEHMDQELDVRFVLHGSVRYEQRRMRILLQLSDLKNSTLLWAERFERELADHNLFALQDDLCQRIMAHIADNHGVISRVLQHEQQHRTAETLSAYEAALLFQNHDTILSTDNHPEIIRQLQQVLDYKLDDALVWAMLAELHADNYALFLSPAEQSLRPALDAADRALMIEPRCQYAHWAMSYGLFFNRDLAGCIRHAQKCIDLNPNAVTIVGQAGWLMALAGQWRRGLEIVDRAIELNPYLPGWIHGAAYMDFYRRGEYEHALHEAQAYNMPEFFVQPLFLAAALSQLGKEDEAHAMLNRAIHLQPDLSSNAREILKPSVVSEELIEQLLDGLSKVGLNTTQN